MAERLRARAARQRIGTALSRHLLGALSGVQPGSGRGTRLLMPSMGGSGLELEAVSQPSSEIPAQPDARPYDQGALTPPPEPEGFRVYSPFGHNVEVIPRAGDVEVGDHPMETADEDHPEVTAEESAGLPELLDDPPRRRSWLLAKALETHPLEQALDLARVAEAFITGASAVETLPEPAAPDTGRSTDRTPEAGPNQAPGPKVPRPRLGLAPETRDRLLERLAQGARNAELASEFNLSPKQVQGIRIGSAREISRRRNRATDEG